MRHRESAKRRRGQTHKTGGSHTKLRLSRANQFRLSAAGGTPMPPAGSALNNDLVRSSQAAAGMHNSQKQSTSQHLIAHPLSSNMVRKCD
jgi:hypothetical protein